MERIKNVMKNIYVTEAIQFFSPHVSKSSTWNLNDPLFFSSIWVEKSYDGKLYRRKITMKEIILESCIEKFLKKSLPGTLKKKKEIWRISEFSENIFNKVWANILNVSLFKL